MEPWCWPSLRTSCAILPMKYQRKMPPRCLPNWLPQKTMMVSFHTFHFWTNCAAKHNLITSQFSSSEDYNISISRKMLTNIFKTLLYYQWTTLLINGQLFSNSSNNLCKKTSTKKLLKFITSKWERLNKSEPTLLIICCNIKLCLDLLPKSQTLQI